MLGPAAVRVGAHGGHQRDVGEPVDGPGQVEVEPRCDAGALEQFADVYLDSVAHDLLDFYMT